MDFNSILYLVAGIYLLIKGADLFVEGSSAIAKFFKIPALIIGLTLVSIGTSLPELSVSITASINGNNGVSFGNVIGSNIFNILVVVGFSAIFTPMIISKSMRNYDLPILLGIYVLLALLAFVISPFVLENWEGILILVLFILYLVFLVIRSVLENKNKPSEENNVKVEANEENEEKRPMILNIGYVVLGVILIIVGGDLVVNGATSIATSIGEAFHIEKEKLNLLIGLTVVAVGTSLPELVTSIVAAKKGENEIAIGNAVGSCIFNVLLILGTASSIFAMPLAGNTYVDIAVMFIAALLLFVFSFKKLRVNKTQGLIFIILYVAYLAYAVVTTVIIA